jgi:hypothetical protein
MTASQLRARLEEEIRELPDSRLQEVYDLIHVFRLGLQREQVQDASDVMRFAGAWDDLNDFDDFDAFDAEIRARRRTAFSTRRRHEASAD